MTETPKKLGTFAGVFTPSALTILGIILFMRMGYVVGSAGFYQTLIIIGMANIISVLTSISLSAIATNIKVKGGGDYYLISRTLGVEFGGAIGIVLFLAQSVSIAFYCVGFGEAVTYMFPEAGLSPRIVAAVAISLLFILAWQGADWATKFQYGVMALLVTALVSFYVGGISQWHTDLFVQNWAAPEQGDGFWLLFALFFPAVTGFTQGVSMSGDLADPGKSLPLGTFLAVGVSIVVYFSVAIVFSGALANPALMADYSAMKKIAWYGIWIDAGVVAATLSSAMASFLGAPRILQSLSQDRVFGLLNPFAKGYGPGNNPRRGVLLSLAIAFATLALGQLNMIARVVSMFFLISYGLLNYATFYEARAASPSFRPRFKYFDLRASLLGFLACLCIMLAIDVKNGLIAIAILFGIYQYLKRTAGWSRWADGSRSYHLQQIRYHLRAAGADPEHPRDWRPQILAFTHDPHRRRRLLQFARWIEGRSGFTSAVQIISGEGYKAKIEKQSAQKELAKDITAGELSAFPLVIASNDFETALNILAQAYGVGPLHANTVLVNWFDQMGKGMAGAASLRYTEYIRLMFRMGCNVLILNTDEQKWQNIPTDRADKFIDIWWQDNATGRLMLIFAYLMTRNDLWEDAVIRLFAEADEKENGVTLTRLKDMLAEYRITAKPATVEKFDDETVAAHSAEAAVMFYPFRIRQYRLTDVKGLSLERIMKKVPVAVLTMAAEDIDLSAEPEEGAAGDLAAATDHLAMAEKKEKAAKKEFEAAREKLVSLQQDRVSNENPDSDVTEAEEALQKAEKKAAEAAAHMQQALTEAEKLGYKAPEEEEAP